MLSKLLYFFPFQLFLFHIKRNHILLFFWLVIFGITSGGMVEKYGIPYLFLGPEYLGKTSFISYAIFGLSFAGFVMSFNITSYVINGVKFPFVATLDRPFLKYCINNSLFPTLFIFYYCYQITQFNIQQQEASAGEIVRYILGFLSGYTLFIIVSLTYFFTTNKNVFHIFGTKQPTEEDNPNKPVNSFFLKEEKWYAFLKNNQQWETRSYLINPFRVKLARDTSHYRLKTLREVLSQNHLNASLFEIIIIISIVVLGFFREQPFLAIPAGSSLLLLLTLTLMLTSAVHSWLKGWTTIVLIALIFGVNYLSTYELFSYQSHAIGLNYNTTKVPYNLETITDLDNDKSSYEKDKSTHINILEKWKAKNQITNEKPKILFINNSGGGSRAMLWSFYVIQQLNKESKGKFIDQTHLICGSSGGMIGASYFRELALLNKQNKLNDIYDRSFAENMSKDLLNPIAFSIATHDFFIRTQYFKDGKYNYLKDRGYAFERELNKITNGAFTKRLKDYQEEEATAKIPMAIYAPTILNDGRRLLISPQPLSFLNSKNPQGFHKNHLVENVEYSKLFKNNDPLNMRISSAIRMNATFPYILPSVTLPTTPSIDVMDAGMRDNYGFYNTVNYIYHFKKWISENTSGVVIVEIRDKEKALKIPSVSNKTLMSNLLKPVGSIFDNLFPIQDYHFDTFFQLLSDQMEHPIDIIEFQLDNPDDARISLSWHLTKKEKNQVYNSFLLPINTKAKDRLFHLMDIH